MAIGEFGRAKNETMCQKRLQSGDADEPPPAVGLPLGMMMGDGNGMMGMG